MPINSRDPADIAGIFQYGIPDLPEPGGTAVSWSDSLGASWQRENAMTSYMYYNKNRPGALTEQELEDLRSGNWNPLEHAKSMGYDKDYHLNKFATARSKREFDWMVGNFEREDRNNEILANSTTTQQITGGILAGGLDPLWAPTLAIPTIRAGLITRVLGTSATSAGLVGVSEATLHRSQATRTLKESMYNIGAGAMFGALLGPLGKNATPDEVARIKQNLEDELSGVQVFLGDSASSARVDPSLPEGYMAEIQRRIDAEEITEREAAVLVRNKRLDYTKLKNEGLMKVFAFASPMLRVATSRSVKAREILENMVEDSFIRTKNEFGYTSGPAVETIVRGQVNGAVSTTMDVLNEAYAKYVGSTSKISQTVSRAKDKTILSFDEFADRVGKAQFRGDKDAIEEITEAAKRLRSEIDIPMEKQLVDAGVLKTGEDGKVRVASGDESYASRIYNFDKIQNDRIGFKRAIIDGIRRAIKDPEELAKFNDTGNQRILHRSLDETINKIVANPTGHFDGNLVPETGFLKARTLKIRSEAIMDYLITDPRVMKESYMRSVSPQLELGKRFNSADLADEIDTVRTEYAALIEDAADKPKEVKKLVAEQNRVERDLLAMRDQILHRYKRPEDPTSVWSRAGHAVRAHNFVTSLGGMTVASLTDTGSVIARIGLKPFAKGLFTLVNAPKQFNIARKQARKMAAGLDVALNNRAQSMMMMEESISSQTKWDRMIDKGVRTFSKATGMTYWNASLKQFAGTMYLDELGGLVTKRPTKKQVEHLAAAGINKDVWNRIRSQWKKHGTEEEGLRSPNIEKWDDPEAAQILSSAMLKEVDTAVVTPGIGDLPLVSRGEVGKLIFQFKSFALASHNRILLAGTQRMGLDQTAGFIQMMSMGAMVYGLKEYAAGREPTSDWNTLVREMIDNSGYFGYLSTANAITEKTTRGAVGLQALIGGDPITKYQSRSVIGDIMGPTFGKASDYARAIGVMSNVATGEEISESDIRAVRRLLPYQNLIYIRRILNEIEEAIQ